MDFIVPTASICPDDIYTGMQAGSAYLSLLHHPHAGATFQSELLTGYFENTSAFSFPTQVEATSTITIQLW